MNMNTTMPKPKIFFCGDNHSHFKHIIDAVREHQPDAIVLLGDIEAKQPLEMELAPILGKTEIRFIHGNHDTDSEENWRYLAHSRLGHLNLNARVDTVAGVRIAGLGGVFREKVWSPWGPKHFDTYEALSKDVDRCQRFVKWSVQRAKTTLLNHSSTIFPDVYDALAMLRADVLVVHEAPSCHPHGFDAIDLLAQAMGVKTVFHGHHHDRLDYRSSFDKLGFRTHGVGFCGITDLEGNLVLAGDYDDRRLRTSPYDKGNNGGT
ncbi:MAG: metallophosphoesterase [Betaproteobacteria bacterium]|jgi:predicted phosphodiesterase